MEKPLNVGVIGCGHIARTVHLPILQRLPGVRVTGVADPQQLPPGIAGFADYRQLLEQPGLAAVVIAAPNAFHAEIATAAFARGLHVYLEKPIALTLGEADQVIAAWRKAGTVGMIGFNYRFNPLLDLLRRQMGTIGKLVAARSVFSLAPRAMPDWKHSRQTGGGVLLDLASHHIDLAPFLFGETISSVTATVRSVQLEADTATLEIQFPSGLRLQSFFSWCAVEEDRWEVFGTAGKLTMDRYAGSVGYRWRKRFAPGGDVSYRIALEHFITAIRTGKPVSPDLLDGRHSLAAVVPGVLQ